MEQLYVETNVKKKTTAKVIILKVVLVIAVLLLFSLTLYNRLLLVFGLGAAVLLFWYWPRFKEEWEYIFCDGQLDFDIIQGGERRKHKVRVEIENADAVAPIDSPRLDGYRHLQVLNYSSLNTDAELYGIVTKVSEQGEKVMILFEPNEKMIQAMYSKCPNIVEKPANF
jgi:hypothetical protein